LRSSSSSNKAIFAHKQHTHIETMTIPLYPDIVTIRSPGRQSTSVWDDWYRWATGPRPDSRAPGHGGPKVDGLCQQIHDATKGLGVRCVWIRCEPSATKRSISNLSHAYCPSLSLPIKRQANKQKVIDAVAQDATTRAYIAIRYKEMFSKELSDVMKKEFSGEQTVYPSSVSVQQWLVARTSSNSKFRVCR
jgi:hypothetical protein